MEIKPTYVTFEQAKLLKEKGFNVKVKPFYNGLQNNEFVISDIIQTNNNLPKWYPAPEQWVVVEWLRLNHDIHITYDVGLSGYYGLIKYRHSNGSLYLSRWTNEQENPLNSPQEATSAAIDYILTKYFN